MKKQKEIGIKSEKIKYSFKRSRRAKRLRLCVRRGGELAVTAPLWMPFWAVEKFILEKSEWIMSKVELMGKFLPDEESVFKNTKEYLTARKEALDFAEKKVAEWNVFYGFKVGKISVRKQKSRWGSCSKSGNLSFNLRINKISERHADYIVVHELCHLGEFNHSEKFWKLVEKTFPDYKIIRRELRSL